MQRPYLDECPDRAVLFGCRVIVCEKQEDLSLPSMVMFSMRDIPSSSIAVSKQEQMLLLFAVKA